MSFPRWFRFALTLTCLTGMLAAADKPATKAAPAAALLPEDFEGWHKQGHSQVSSDAAVADPANAAILKEYRFSDFESASYTRDDDDRTLKIRAARFDDASGAFGAYTFYLRRDMRSERIGDETLGDQGASLGNRVLFYRGHILVDALFSQESAMSGAQLRTLAGELPRPKGNSGNLPTFILFMPHRDYVANTQKYVMGPAALAAQGSPVPADLVDFDASSEVSLGNYSTPSGEATLMLISYPTPQLATEHLKRIDAAHHMAQPQPWVAGVEGAGSFYTKRSGTLVVIAAGGIADSDAKSLLNQVNYEARVTWNTPSENAQVRDLYMLILNIVVLCAILAGLAIIAGVAFGGIRILMKRLYPDKVFDRPEAMEFISLRLTETVVKGVAENEGGESQPAGQNPC